MNYFFDDIEYARERLIDTFIMKDGEPVRIVSIDYDQNCVYQTVPDRHTREVALCTEEGFSLEPFRLGYINLKGKAYFLARSPLRRWKQGLDPKGLILDGAMYRVDLDVMISQPFVDTCKGVYPSLKEAYELIDKEENTSVAFSNTFCIERKPLGNIMLKYRGKDVGFADNMILKLGRNYEFLAEYLEEITNG